MADANDNISSNKRIAKNTMILYLRMLFTVGISFYTTRLVMANLGVSDYGLYGVLGSVMSMMYMVTASINTSISRYLTFNLGAGNTEDARRVFSSSTIILIIFSICIIIIGEAGGTWYIDNKLNVALERISAAHWVFQFILLAFVLEFLSIPYNATIVAHERFKAFAFITIQDVLTRLIIAFAILLAPFDKLVFYAALMCVNNVVLRLVYYIYCKRNFDECRFALFYDKAMFKDLLSYSSLAFIPSVVCMFSTSGLALIVNAFYGTVANAAQGVASQLNSIAGAFARNFTPAINPQITKSFAANDKGRSLSLVYMGTKITFLLLYIPILPIIFNVNFVLDIWLDEVPPYANFFVVLGLINALVTSLQAMTGTLISATGDIRMKAVVASIAYAIPLPICMLFFKMGYPPYMSSLALVLAAIITFYPNVVVANHLTGIRFREYLRRTLFPLLCVVVLTSVIMVVLNSFFEDSWLKLIVTTIVSTGSILVISYGVALRKTERIRVREMISEKLHLQ